MAIIRRLSSTLCLSLFLFLSAEFLSLSLGEVGTAGHYKAPYIPTACYGSDVSKFQSSNMFGAAGEGVWDNGASCGRQYLVRCISAAVPKTCIPDKTIQIRIVDRAFTSVSRPPTPAPPSSSPPPPSPPSSTLPLPPLTLNFNRFEAEGERQAPK